MIFHFLFGCILFQPIEIDLEVKEPTIEDTSCWDDPSCRDADQDGYPEEEDCDDQDSSAIGMDVDEDCDGIVNELDACPLDPWNDVDKDGLCAEEDPVCNLDFLFTADSFDEESLLLNSCKEVEGDIVFYQSNEIELRGFENLSVIDGNVFIVENKELKSIDLFPYTTKISGEFLVLSNPQLQKLRGLSSVLYLGFLGVFDNSELCHSEIFTFLDALDYPEIEQNGNADDC